MDSSVPSSGGNGGIFFPFASSARHGGVGNCGHCSEVYSQLSHQFLQFWRRICSAAAFVPLLYHLLDLHGGQDDSILSAIQAKSRSKSGHQKNSCQITESRQACAKLVPKLLLRIPLYVDFLILIPLCCMSMSIIASSAYLLGP